MLGYPHYTANIWYTCMHGDRTSHLIMIMDFGSDAGLQLNTKHDVSKCDIISTHYDIIQITTMHIYMIYLV